MNIGQVCIEKMSNRTRINFCMINSTSMRQFWANNLHKISLYTNCFTAVPQVNLFIPNIFWNIFQWHGPELTFFVLSTNFRIYVWNWSLSSYFKLYIKYGCHYCEANETEIFDLRWSTKYDKNDLLKRWLRKYFHFKKTC